jgi:hypothetical protein
MKSAKQIHETAPDSAAFTPIELPSRLQSSHPGLNALRASAAREGTGQRVSNPAESIPTHIYGLDNETRFSTAFAMGTILHAEHREHDIVLSAISLGQSV